MMTFLLVVNTLVILYLAYFLIGYFIAGRCPVCRLGKLDILTQEEITEAIRNGTFATAVTLYTRVHLRCARCREVFSYKFGDRDKMERTELPITGLSQKELK